MQSILPCLPSGISEIARLVMFATRSGKAWCGMNRVERRKNAAKKSAQPASTGRPIPIPMVNIISDGSGGISVKFMGAALYRFRQEAFIALVVIFVRHLALAFHMSVEDVWAKVEEFKNSPISTEITREQ